MGKLKMKIHFPTLEICLSNLTYPEENFTFLLAKGKVEHNVQLPHTKIVLVPGDWKVEL